MVEFLAQEAALSILAQLMSRMLIIVRPKCICWYVKQKTIYKIENGLSVCFVFFFFFLNFALSLYIFRLFFFFFFFLHCRSFAGGLLLRLNGHRLAVYEIGREIELVTTSIS